MSDDRKIRMAGTNCGYDMTKKIVMGPYHKYNENSPWFSHSCNIIGEVRIIEGILCHAVDDIEKFDEQYDPCSQRDINSRNVIRWEPYDSTQ